MRRGRGGNMILEAAMWMPVFFLLIVGMLQVGKITYLYYTLKKTEDTAARYLSVQSGVNFCPDAIASDPNVQAAIQFALTGTTDGSGPLIIPSLTPDMLQVVTECIDPATGLPGPCDAGGCNTGSPMGAQRPDYIVVTIPNGYPVQPRIPFLLLDPIPLKPTVAVPFGGTS
jgi:hypothetical protein